MVPVRYGRQANRNIESYARACAYQDALARNCRSVIEKLRSLYRAPEGAADQFVWVLYGQASRAISTG